MTPLEDKKRGGSRLLGGLGVCLFLLLWEITGQNRWLGLTCPALSEVLVFLFTPSRQGLFLRALGASLASFGIGFSLGCVTGIVLAIVSHNVSALRPSLDTASVFIHAIPSIALAPVLILLIGRENTPAALSFLGTAFILYVTATSSFASLKPQWRDMMRVLGASSFIRVRFLDIPASLPVVLSGMRLAAPSAVIGVIIGEWFGASRGIGVLIINAMQNFQIPLLWSGVTLAVLVSLCFFSLFGLMQIYAERRFR